MVIVYCIRLHIVNSFLQTISFFDENRLPLRLKPKEERLLKMNVILLFENIGSTGHFRFIAK